MKQNKKMILFFLLLTVGIYLSIQSSLDAKFFVNHYNTESIRLKSGSIDKKSLQAAKERMIRSESNPELEITAWSPLGIVEVENIYLDRKKKVTGILVDGDMKVTAPLNLVCGNYVYSGDSHGCVIDSKTAYALYGTKNAVGNRVRYQKKTYCIRGVVQSQIPIVLIQGTDKSMGYTNLELRFSNMENGEVEARNFVLYHQLAEDFLVLDGYFYGRMISSVLIYPMWLFYLLLTMYLIKSFGNHSGMNKSGGTRKLNHGFAAFCKKDLVFGVISIVLIAVGYGVVLYKLVGNPFYLPIQYIPTKWSDFHYWSDRWNELRDQFVQMQYLTPNPKDVMLVQKISKLSLWVTLVSIVYSVLFLYGRSIKKTWILSADRIE